MRNPGGNNNLENLGKNGGIIKGIFKELDRREWIVSVRLTIVQLMWCY
jgi:hypothetical protein